MLLKSLNQKINSNKITNLLLENELKKLQTFDSIYFREKNGTQSYFEEGGTQNYLVFQPMCRYFKKVNGAGTGSYHISSNKHPQHLLNFETARCGTY